MSQLWHGSTHRAHIDHLGPPKYTKTAKYAPRRLSEIPSRRLLKRSGSPSALFVQIMSWLSSDSLSDTIILELTVLILTLLKSNFDNRQQRLLTGNDLQDSGTDTDASGSE